MDPSDAPDYMRDDKANVDRLDNEFSTKFSYMPLKLYLLDLAIFKRLSRRTGVPRASLAGKDANE